jgi:hypothetical protein
MRGLSEIYPANLSEDSESDFNNTFLAKNQHRGTFGALSQEAHHLTNKGSDKWTKSDEISVN